MRSEKYVQIRVELFEELECNGVFLKRREGVIELQLDSWHIEASDLLGTQDYNKYMPRLINQVVFGRGEKKQDE